MNKTHNECETSYVFPGIPNEIEEFKKILRTYAKAKMPVVVFKVAFFSGDRVTHFEYFFHGNGFEARLVAPVERISDDVVDNALKDVATICRPLSAPTSGTITDKGLKVTK